MNTGNFAFYHFRTNCGTIFTYNIFKTGILEILMKDVIQRNGDCYQCCIFGITYLHRWIGNFNPSRYITSLSVTDSIGVFHYLHMWHISLNFHYTQKPFYAIRNSGKFHFTLTIHINYLMVDKWFLEHDFVKYPMKLWWIILHILHDTSGFKKWISVNSFSSTN